LPVVAHAALGLRVGGDPVERHGDLAREERAGESSKLAGTFALAEMSATSSR
jgi:hypothetical protein